jgi:hypothetical protein
VTRLGGHDAEGLDEMDKRAEVISSRWKIVTLVMAGLVLATSLVSRAVALVSSKQPKT